MLLNYVIIVFDAIDYYARFGSRNELYYSEAITELCVSRLLFTYKTLHIKNTVKMQNWLTFTPDILTGFFYL